MRDLITEAVRFAVSIERKCYDFYRKAALTAASQVGRQIFERLASEEARHIGALRDEAPALWSEVQHPLQQPGMDCPLNEPQGSLFEQLRHALLNKQYSIDLYTTLARSFREPSICRVFETTLQTARKELRSIRQEYLQGDSITATSLITRRPRRSHLRCGLQPPPPNKHSQLFFSMLDSGRQSQNG